MPYDEEIPYLSHVPQSIVEGSEASTQDELQYDTLKQVGKFLHEQLDTLDKWHAFELKPSESDLSIKQQIVAHRLAYELLAPAVSAVDAALEAVDSKYKQR